MSLTAFYSVAFIEGISSQGLTVGFVCGHFSAAQRCPAAMGSTSATSDAHPRELLYDLAHWKSLFFHERIKAKKGLCD